MHIKCDDGEKIGASKKVPDQADDGSLPRKLIRDVFVIHIKGAFGLMNPPGRTSDDSRYVANVTRASVIHWGCLAVQSVEARARFIKSKPADIDRQLAPTLLAIANIAIDAERDSVTADLWRSLNKKTVYTKFCTRSLAVVGRTVMDAIG